MYGVIFLTVFVDLVVAVGVGVFVANTLTIDKLSQLRSDKGVTAITDSDDAIKLTAEEKALLAKGRDRILLFSLSGPMIFGVAKAIARQHKAVQKCQTMVLDLSEVPHLGVTTSLSIENAIQEAVDGGKQVFVVGATGQTYKRLTKLGLLNVLPAERFLEDRTIALRQALATVDTGDSAPEADYGATVAPQPI